MSSPMDQTINPPETFAKVTWPCPLCGGVEQRELYPDTLEGDLPSFGYDFTPDHMRTYRVVFCPLCQHGFCSPRPRQLWQQYEEIQDPTYLHWQKDRIASARQVLRRMLRYRSSGRLLDIGCATGDFLSMASAHYSAEGLELSGWAAEIARSRGLKIHSCTLADFHPDQPYDLLTLWGVIEHFEDPLAEIHRMQHLLRPGGMVCLWIGDIASWLARFFGKDWWYIQGQHLQIFSRKSLRESFRRGGFQEVWIGRYSYVTTLQSIARSLGRYPVLGLAAKRLVSPRGIGQWTVTLKLPGEMFAIFKKT